jgi:VWFA-related protein
MKRLLFVILFTLCATGISQQHEPYTVSVDVDLVLLNVRVTEHGDQSVKGLDAKNFRIYEDQRLQDIAFFTGQDAPATVGLAVDMSASMSPKWHEVQTAVALFAAKSNPQDEMFIVQFNQDLHWPLDIGNDFTSNVREIEKSMTGVIPQGKTALYDAVHAALDHINGGQFEKRILVVLSDGSDNSSAQSLNSLLSRLQRANVTVFTIGLYDPDARDRNPGVLRHLASVTGGEAFFPKDQKELREAWQRIAAGIRTEYTLGYYPRIGPDGNYHKLSVVVDSPASARMSVRTRPGYSAPLKQNKVSR